MVQKQGRKMGGQDRGHFIVEILKLLVPSTVPLEIRSRSKDSLTPSDVAAALGLACSREASMFCRVVYLGEDSEQLVGILTRKLQKEFTRMAPKPLTFILSDMIRLGLNECSRHNRCPRCLGVAQIGNYKCESCDGSGFKRPSDKSRSDFLNMDKRNYRRRWSKVYREVVLPLMSDLEIEAQRIYMKLG